MFVHVHVCPCCCTLISFLLGFWFVLGYEQVGLLILLLALGVSGFSSFFLCVCY